MVKVKLLKDVEGLGGAGDKVSLPVDSNEAIARLKKLEADGAVEKLD